MVPSATAELATRAYAPAGPRENLAFAMLCAFAALMYVAPAEWIPGAASLRPALLTSVLATALVVVRRVGLRETFVVDGRRGLSLCALSALALASSFWSVAPETTRASALELVKLVAIYLTLVNLVTTRKRLAVLALAVVFASTVTSVGAISWYLRGEDLVEGFRARWVGGYSDPNRLAMALCVVVPLAFAFLVRPVHLLIRVGCGVAAALAVTAMVFSHSRGSFLGLAVGMGMWALLARKQTHRLWVALAIAAMAVFAPQSFWDRTETVRRFQADASALGRVHAWEITSSINTAHPLVGVGFNTFQAAWPSYAGPGMVRAYAAHNVFLQVLAELGLVGLALFLLFVGGTVAGAYTAGLGSGKGAWLARGVAAAATGYLVCNLASGFVLSPHLFVVLGLAACAERVER